MVSCLGIVLIMFVRLFLCVVFDGVIRTSLTVWFEGVIRTIKRKRFEGVIRTIMRKGARQCWEDKWIPSWLESSWLLGSPWLFYEGGMWRVGHGKSIKAWEDKWIPSFGPMVFRNELTWERNMVELLCWPPTATTILSIPLPMQPREDCFFWPETINGCYSVKTGYNFIRKKHMEENASTSSTPSLSHA